MQSESPWAWVLLFTAAALVGGTLIAPKYAVRQGRLERMDEGRQRAAQQAQGYDSAIDQPAESYEEYQAEHRPTLRWLMLGLAVLMVAASTILMLRERRMRRIGSPGGST